jgi:hypothetical protein
MTRFPWVTKGVRRDTDSSSPSPEEARLGEWSTSRRELWCFYLYYVVRFSLFVLSFPFFIVDQRATVDSPHSSSGCLNSRISYISLAMTRPSHHSLNNVVGGPIVCYPIWDTSAIVRLSPACVTPALLMNGPPSTSLVTRSQFDHSTHKWDKLCHSGSPVTDDRRLGRLWDMEVRRD